MGLIDPSWLASLTNKAIQSSPGASYIGNQIRKALPYVGGPMSTQKPAGPFPAIRNTGASARIGNTGTLRGAVAGTPSVPTPTTPVPAADPLADLYSQLVAQLQQPVAMPTSINTEDLMDQVKKAINPIYDQRASAAQGRSDRNRKEVQDMYAALAQNYKDLAPAQEAQAAKAQQDVEQLYGQLRSNLQGDYARVSKEQSDLFSQLGIQDALPDVLQKQQAPVQDALTAAAENQAQQQQRYMDMGNADATYYREGSPNAIMAGNEISTDMLNQLTDYLNQIEAERTSGIQSGYLDQLGSAQNRLAQEQQSAQSEMARRQGMLWDMLQGQLTAQNKAASSPLSVDSFMGGLPSNMQSSVGNAFTRLQRSPEAIYGKVEDKRNPVPGTFVDTTPEWYMSQADEMLRRGEIDPTTHQALQMYLQLYFNTDKSQ